MEIEALGAELRRREAAVARLLERTARSLAAQASLPDRASFRRMQQELRYKARQRRRWHSPGGTPPGACQWGDGGSPSLPTFPVTPRRAPLPSPARLPVPRRAAALRRGTRRLR